MVKCHLTEKNEKLALSDIWSYHAHKVELKLNKVLSSSIYTAPTALGSRQEVQQTSHNTTRSS